MDREQAITKARQFADQAFGTELGKISREFQAKLTEALALHAAQGVARSGSAIAQTAAINGEKVTVMLRTRLELLLEGFDMHHVVIDDQLTTRVVNELGALRSTWINSSKKNVTHTGNTQRVVSAGTYMRILENNVGMHPNEIRTQIDRKRYMSKKTEGTPSIQNIYHVSGNNNRWLTNSQDDSVNIITQSSDQIFATLRQEIESKIPAGNEQKDILERLLALEQAQNSPTFKQRYTEFIASAANHMQLIAPFIPAITEMLQKSL